MARYELKINRLDSMIFNTYEEAVNERERRERIRRDKMKNGIIAPTPNYEIKAIE